ncbi:hypothetical protein FRZ61_09300 [Hypericibacter adhaerens]|jgi:death-on-curing protein|uniref:Fido domain-containing protein n=1 Tax=Hypericibacter adhaerens TaxID=2602016 RepID=A0A5J6MXQ2_9PROT|nr:type II toxin-antitoxin system death-on-curing family toxin [Hypericibacter adhaerens]QEX21010.1 hypothetical protein FRZ61_09300 [Hypericibacter adhaerens]
MAVPYLAPEIQIQFDQVLAQVGPNDPYDTDKTIGIIDVLRAHFTLADFFLAGEGRPFGGVGPRDLGLLHSAMSRQFVEYGGLRKWTTSYDLCATLFFGLIKDHPFIDANKRTAFLILLYHLKRFKLAPDLPQVELEDFAVAVADNNLIKYARFRDAYAELPNRADSEVRFISEFLRKKTRSLDVSQPPVTYRELDTILRRFDLQLDDPYRNYIDVVRFIEKKPLFGKPKLVKQRVAHVGFPGWSKQVPRDVLKAIRERAGLTPERGYDSATFFRDARPIDCLIHEYQAPLRRLAFR